MNSSISHSQNDTLGYVRADNHDFNSPENEERGYSLKFTMIDNVLTAQVKWLDEDKYSTVFVSDIGNSVTPSGFIQIIGLDGANIIFDNLKITNLDKKPVLKEVAYRSNVFQEVPDYEYTQQEIKYLKVEQKNDIKWYLLPIIALGTSVVLVGLTVGICVLKRKKEAKRGGEKHEEI